MNATAARIYQCPICRTTVEALHQVGPELTCCREMEPLPVNCGGVEGIWHDPVIVPADGGIIVRVALRPHPMGGDHHIVWIDATNGHENFRKYLQPFEVPEAYFPLPPRGTVARALCNRHGLWRNVSPEELTQAGADRHVTANGLSFHETRQ